MPGTLRVHAKVEARGLIDDLNSVELGLGKAVNQAIMEAGRVVLRSVPRFTPYDSKHRSLRRDAQGRSYTQGHMRDSFELRPAGRGSAAIVSSHPAALVFEWGGTIQPKGAPIRIREHGMARRAGEAEAAQFERALGEQLNELTARHGL